MKLGIEAGKMGWKVLLGGIGMAIFLGSIAYTSHLVNQIAAEERTQVELWAQAIHQKAIKLKESNALFAKITAEEQKKAALWARAVQALEDAQNLSQDVGFIFDVIRSNETIPVILTNEKGVILSVKNVPDSIAHDAQRLAAELRAMKQQRPPLSIQVSDNIRHYLYYKDSQIFTTFKQVIQNTLATFIAVDVIGAANLPVLYVGEDQQHIIAHNIEATSTSTPASATLLQKLKKEMTPIRVEVASQQYHYIYYQKSRLLYHLQLFPYIQFLLIGLFFGAAYLVLRNHKKAEQHQIWVGMAKEAAHQLGTPISSLMAWKEVLLSSQQDQGLLEEMGKDIHRLELIADRFSKIGSPPALAPHDLLDCLSSTLQYLESRLSKQIRFVVNTDQVSSSTQVALNLQLWSWVIENLTKNAVDAMGGRGTITYQLSTTPTHVVLAISDQGKGIPKNQQKKIFEAGFTTKKRGWGLGLTLVKRIVTSYHNGKIELKSSELGKGTTFQIQLEKARPKVGSGGQKP